MRLVQLDMNKWDEALSNSSFLFHTSDMLKVLDKHTSGDLRLFAGFNGQELFGLFPIFVKEKLGFQIALSPPPGFGIRELGPILFQTSPKRSKHEKLHRDFIESVINSVDKDNRKTLFRTCATPNYCDPRPFQWAGFETSVSFTYKLELKSKTPEEVLKSFSRSLRRDIRKGNTSDVKVRIERNKSSTRNIYETIKTRYDNQQKNTPLSWEFMRDTVESLGKRAKLYVAESTDDEFLSGIVVLYSDETAYFWKGGTGRSEHDFSINSLLHWQIIKDIINGRTEHDIKRYDFHTANNERLVRYKRKFNPELVSQYRIKSTGVAMAIVEKAYRRLFM